MKDMAKKIMTGALLALALVILPVFSLWAQPPFFMNAVPYHSQIPLAQWAIWGEPGNPNYPNNWCTVACIDMVFDRYDNVGHPNPPLPQQQIAAAANTDDAGRTSPPAGWPGTYADDARRAAHFSMLSRAVAPPKNWGYSWRTWGFGAVDANWKTNNWTQNQFKTLISSGYPIIVHLNADSVNAYRDSMGLYPSEGDTSPVFSNPVPATVCGHSEVLIGYNDNPLPPATPYYIVHDPALGRFLTWPQNLFWNSLWTGDFLFAWPWTLQKNAPLFVMQNSKFWVGENVTYTGPAPLGGWHMVANPTASLGTPPSFSLPNNDPTHNLQFLWWGRIKIGVTTTGSSQWTWWQVQATNQAGAFGVNARGTVGPLNSSSYKKYSDVIGGADGFGVGLVWRPGGKVGLAGGVWPWNDLGTSFAPAPPSPGVPTEVLVWIHNYGEEPATNVELNLFWSDPNVCQHYPDPRLNRVGTENIREIPPLDSVLVGPISFTPPTGGNYFADPFFDVFIDISCDQDTGTTGWMLEDDNVGCKSTWSVEGTPGVPVEMHLWATNPLTVDAKLVLGLDKSGLLQDWDVRLTPPEGEVMDLGPMESREVIMAVTPSLLFGGPGTAKVYASLLNEAGEFVKVTGGLALEVTTPSPPAKPFKDRAVTLLDQILASPLPVKIRNDLEQAKRNVESSLKYFDSDSTLSEKFGHKTFADEKQAVVKIKDAVMRAKEEEIAIWDDLREVCICLMDADRSVARTAINIAERNPAHNDDELKIAEDEMAKAEEEIAKSEKRILKLGIPWGRYDKAIDHFRKAWEHAQLATKVVVGGEMLKAHSGRAERFGLNPISPNPAFRTAEIAFTLAKEGRILLTVYDVSGRPVERIMDGQLTGGLHKLEWRGVDSQGRRVPSGFYFIRLSDGERHATEKVLLLN